MSYTIDDVEKHKKGLTDKKKKQWVRIANAALSVCMKKGGTDEECAAKAIKQANGVVNNNAEAATYSMYIPVQDDYEVKIVTHEEKPYLVAPVVIMVEGVHNGSHGPLLHKMEELAKFPESWNGRPVVINHPEIEGKSVSANSPEIIETYAVGKVYSTNPDGNKLRAEIWFDEEKLNTLSPLIYGKINNNERVEVSVGVFSEEIEEEGEWNGEQYTAIAINHRPDHLAVLTEAVGACSCKDGCGIRSNNQNKENMEKNLLESIKILNFAGFGISQLQVNEEGYRERMDMVYDKLSSLNSDKVWNYLEEMYDDYLIYAKSGDNDRKMYKQSYKVESGKIEFVGEPIEVRKKVEFVTNQIVRTKFKKEVNMSKECAPCIKTKVDALIANSKGRWTEDDREFLQTLEEGQLDKMAPVEVEKVVEKEVQVNALSDEDKEALATYKSEQKAKRDKMIAEIQANTSKETWPDDVLNKMDKDVLVRVYNSVKKEEEDYSLNGGNRRQVNTNSEAPLLPPGITAEK